MMASRSHHARLAQTSFRTSFFSHRSLTALKVTPSIINRSTSLPVNVATRSLTTSSTVCQAVVADPPVIQMVSKSNDATTNENELKPRTRSSIRERRLKTNTRAVSDITMAKFFDKCNWFDMTLDHREILSTLKENSKMELYKSVKLFRTVRSRLWNPTAKLIKTVIGREQGKQLEDGKLDETPYHTKVWNNGGNPVHDVDEWILGSIKFYRDNLSAKIVQENEKERMSRKQQKGATESDKVQSNEKLELLREHLFSLRTMDQEEQIDYSLQGLWLKMTPEEQTEAMVRSQYESARKLGWRYGYSSGYPKEKTDVDNETKHLPADLGKEGEAGLRALAELQNQEEQLAWKAWKKMKPGKRVAEFKAAWDLRDRSYIYLDDSEGSRILGPSMPRWYEAPEHAGKLTFLPNTIVRLVKNFTPAGEPYDSWKATFRVDLNVHKHTLRSYLLAIYGLKTTWARSAIYRSPVTRDQATGEVKSGRGRTWKKVEVGLLEPFLFPEISPEFANKHLMPSEIHFEQARLHMKMTKGIRWRSKKPTQEYLDERANHNRHKYHGLDADAALKQRTDQVEEEAKPRDIAFIARTTGVPSAKHGKILKLLRQKQQEKEQKIQQLVEKYKQQASEKQAVSAE